MNCKVCGLPVKKGMRFVLVGSYPSSFHKMFFPRFVLDDPDIWGELYHEDCYLKSMKDQEPKQKST
jgi:hypothetical protein